MSRINNAAKSINTGARLGSLVVVGEAARQRKQGRAFWVLCTACRRERPVPMLSVQLRRHAASKAGLAGACTCGWSARAHAWRQRVGAA